MSAYLVLRREITDTLSSRHFWVLAAVALLATLAVSRLSSQTYLYQESELRWGLREHRQAVNDLRTHAEAWLRSAHLPSILAVYETRALDLMPSTIDVRLRRVPSIASSGAEVEFTRAFTSGFFTSGRYSLTAGQTSLGDRILSGALSRISVGELLGILFSLLGIVSSFDAIAGERERGTLRLCFCGPLSRASFIWGKFLGCATIAVLPAIACQVLFLAVLIWTFGGRVTNEVFGIAALTGLLVVQVLTYVAMGLGISLASRDSGSALVRALGLWVLAAVVAPTGVHHLMQLAYPSADETDLDLKRSDILRNHREAAYEIISSNWPQDHFIVTGEGSYTTASLRFVTGTREVVEGASKALEEIGPLAIECAEDIYRAERKFEGQLEQWWRTKEVLGSLSPSVAARTASLAICGVDVWSFSRWMQAARRDRDTMTRALAAKFGDLDYFSGIGRGAKIIEDRGPYGRLPTWSDVSVIRPSYALVHEPYSESLRERLEGSGRTLLTPILNMLLWSLWMLLRGRRMRVD